jgi:glutathione S-transferase
MKLYDSGRAPNPRRVRVFLAEKGITVPTEQVDIMARQHKTPGIHRNKPAAAHARARPR